MGIRVIDLGGQVVDPTKGGNDRAFQNALEGMSLEVSAPSTPLTDAGECDPCPPNFGGSAAGTVTDTPFRGGDQDLREIGTWRPGDPSADRAIGSSKRLSDSRARDLARNNGFAAGIVESARDRIVGHRYRLVLQPNHRLIPGLDRKGAREWARLVEPMFQSYFDDPECYIDAQRRRTGVEILRSGEATSIFAGEHMTVREFREDNPVYSTCFNTIEPSRIMNPGDRPIDKDIRGGVELGKFGDPIAYWMRNKHPGDDGLGSDSVRFNPVSWQRIPRHNQFGWLNFFHIFEPTEAGLQTRGISKLAPVLQQFKMLAQFEDAELEAAILSAVYAMTIESQFGPQAAGDALGADFNTQLKEYMRGQMGFRKGSPVVFDGQNITHLYPGEKLVMNKGEHPMSVFADFERAMLRHISRCANMSFEQISGDYSRTTYSSARASMAEAWNHVLGRRATSTNKLATLMFRAWLDEAVARDMVPLPGGVSKDNYLQFRAALTQCMWIGAGRPIIDEVKSANANAKRLETGETTLAAVCAENGMDWEDVQEQLAEERDYRASLQLDLDSVSPVDTGDDDDNDNEDLVRRVEELENA